MIEHAYIHIPFCISKCKYCSFVSGISLEYKDVYFNALLKEIKSRYGGDKLKTLYLGGGTPSLLFADDIHKLIECFKYETNPEITIEANPETVTAEKFKNYLDIGINRVSIGIQTFDDEILKQIGRTHNSAKSRKAVSLVKEAGFDNISIDLIYGLGNQTLKKWETDLKLAKNMDVQHISTYGLKIERGSYYYDKPPRNLPDDEMQAQMYELLCDYLINFNHYEISNFAKHGYESKHNCAYWENKEYYGFGLNASGYEHNVRYKNISSFNEYIENPFKKEESEILTKQDTLENEIFLALRLNLGINVDALNKKYDFDFMKKYGNIISKYEKLGLLIHNESNIRLTRKGILLSNEVMSDFIDCS